MAQETKTGALYTPAACSFPGENARSWEALGEARPGQSSLSVIFLSREGRDLGVAFQAPPGSQASSRGEAKDSGLPSRLPRGVRPHLEGWQEPQLWGVCIVLMFDLAAAARSESLSWNPSIQTAAQDPGPAVLESRRLGPITPPSKDRTRSSGAS